MKNLSLSLLLRGGCLGLALLMAIPPSFAGETTVLEVITEELDDSVLVPAEEVDRVAPRPRPPYPRPRPYPRPVPYPRPRPNPPYPTYPVACYARDNIGQTFKAVGYDSYWVQNEALRQCQIYSYYGGCYALGCWR